MFNAPNAETIGLTETAALFGVHPATVRRWTMKTELGFPPPRRLPNGSLQFDRSAIEAYREQRAAA